MEWAGYIGIPFTEHGRDRAGCDCWGLLRLFYAEQMGIDLPAYKADYATTRDSVSIKRLVAEQLATGCWMPVIGEPEAGDAIVIRVKGQPWHVAVALGNGDMLHARTNSQTCVESLSSVLWRSRIDGVFRYVR